MTEKTAGLLKNLAQKYEVSSFTESDPSRFLSRYSDVKDVEIASFVAAMLSFGSRKQFIPKIEMLLRQADFSGGIYTWIKTGKFESFCAENDDGEKFYRFYSWKDMYGFFSAIKQFLEEYDSFGLYVRSFSEKLDGKLNSCQKSVLAISNAFENCSIVPKGKNSANKRVQTNEVLYCDTEKNH